MPFPSCPCELSPQQFTKPLLRSAQECTSPAATEMTEARLRTGTGALRLVVVPSPNWPLRFRPQHCTEPSSPMAHVCDTPAASRVRRRRAPFSPLNRASAKATEAKTKSGTSKRFRSMSISPPFHRPATGIRSCENWLPLLITETTGVFGVEIMAVKRSYKQAPPGRVLVGVPYNSEDREWLPTDLLQTLASRRCNRPQ